MSYSFDIIGITPVLQFFNHQQQVEAKRDRAQAYLGSYCCTLDAFISATEVVHRRPDWDWDAIVSTIVNFWLSQEKDVLHWKQQFAAAQDDPNLGDQNLIVARVINYDSLRHEFETLFDG
ncbi:hypothetical protein IQ265_00900 [Nodosilinea sp. LEGE 06152]|uniref:hypothetical protein n=1 Tax=Nodosilinea sp. LEGE 06152 TaxID=2777966 RepID=UPI00187FEFFF|nr:hypothetical protein [Nodosilinea sp. LEGE 06152]MBE9155406.1 hypothetical protein [Nodosilinea sp. LEGE 06152]